MAARERLTMADNYKVTGQAPITTADASGTFVPGVEITFTTKPHNIVGRVRVPQSMYTPQQVDELLTANAANIEAVQEL